MFGSTENGTEKMKKEVGFHIVWYKQKLKRKYKKKNY